MKLDIVSAETDDMRDVMKIPRSRVKELETRLNELHKKNRTKTETLAGIADHCKNANELAYISYLYGCKIITNISPVQMPFEEVAPEYDEATEEMEYEDVTQRQLKEKE